jgi:sulfate permease, SulP family
MFVDSPWRYSCGAPRDRMRRLSGGFPETEHFRNVRRHKVFTDPRILSIRIDESPTYLNARWLEEFVLDEVAEKPEVRHLILMCSAVNAIDASALESLEAINHRLADGGVTLHLSEVKGPVDALQRSSLLEHLTGDIFLSQSQAFQSAITIADHQDASPAAPDPWLAQGLISAFRKAAEPTEVLNHPVIYGYRWSARAG